METGFIKYMYDSELEKILNYFQEDPYWHLVFSILAYMGIRSGELIRIKHEDLLGNCEAIRIRLEKSTTSRFPRGRMRDRVVPDRIKRELRAQIRRSRGSEFLFPPDRSGGSRNDHLQTSSIRWKLIKALRALGIQDKYYKNYSRISPHTFRHWFVTRILEITGNDIIAARDIIGHVKAETTMRYAYSLKKENVIMKKI